MESMPEPSVVPDLELPQAGQFVNMPVRIEHPLKARWAMPAMEWHFLVELADRSRVWIRLQNGTSWETVSEEADLTSGLSESPRLD